MTRPLDRVRHEASRIRLAFLIFRDSRGGFETATRGLSGRHEPPPERLPKPETNQALGVRPPPATPRVGYCFVSSYNPWPMWRSLP
jgi:hypothetical protein